MALFGEKYVDRVRVVSVGDFSKELCGGTHVARTGEIGVFRITTETSSAAGIRRLEAVTGHAAIRHYRVSSASVQRIASMMRAPEDSLFESLDKLLSDRKRLERQVSELKAKLARAAIADLLARAREIDGTKVVAAQVPDVDREQLRTLVDALRVRLGTGLVVLGTVQDGRVALIAAATKDIAGKSVHAGSVVRDVARLVGGGGGGRPDMAEAGGRNPGALPDALERVPDLVRAQMSA